MSLIALAEAVDRLVDGHQAFVAESENAATVSALSAEHASQLTKLCEPLGWRCELFDRANEVWDQASDIDPEFGPFRIIIHKPTAADDTLQLLSNSAFWSWLATGHVARHWRVARFSGSVVTGLRVVQSWTGIVEPATMTPTKSPRALVKEFGNLRRVPEDVRCWLSSPLDDEEFLSPATQVWVRVASASLTACLPEEIEADEGDLKFRGPPRLTLNRFDASTDSLDQATFNTLLKTIHWIFELEREAEMRHILLAAELARSGAPPQSTPDFLKEHLAHALESAQIAYQMTLAETGRDTLKILSDLRKAVTEETAKLSDISRQLTGAIAASVATGIGLIAARVAANAPAELIAIVMLVVALYVVMVISSGIQFMRLQRQLRTDWQHRLYRFLPETEYKKMVEQPTSKAERSFVWTAWLGGTAVAVLAIGCAWSILVPTRSIASSARAKEKPVATVKSKGMVDGTSNESTESRSKAAREETGRAPPEKPSRN